jgi:hypothetical protein
MDLKDRRRIQPVRRSCPSLLANINHSIVPYFMKRINFDLRVTAKVPTLVRDFAPFAAVQ